EWVTRYLLQVNPAHLAPRTSDLVRVILARRQPPRNRTRQLEVGMDAVVIVVELRVWIEEAGDVLVGSHPIQHMLDHRVMLAQRKQDILSHAGIAWRAVRFLLAPIDDG